MAARYTPPWLPQSPEAPTSEHAAEPAEAPPAGDPRTGSLVDGSGDNPRKPMQDPLTGRFVKGSSGRPKGSKNRVTVSCELLLDTESERLTRRCIDLALSGDPTALRLCIERIAPLRKGRVLPPIEVGKDERTVEALLRSVLTGSVTPDEAHSVVCVLESAARIQVAQALEEQRRAQLEALKRAAEQGTIHGGVMLVPVTGADEWEVMASDAQRQLKARVKE